MIDRLLAPIAPHSCCGCHEVGSELCDGCKHNIISDGFSGCVGCFRPTRGDNLCPNCNDFAADALWCVGLRSGELKVLIDAYKFNAMRSASLPLAELLHAVLPVLPGNIVVSAVPTVASHNRSRGFDHMERIGRELAGLRGLAFRPLLRKSGSDTQHFKTKKERLKAAQSVFTALPGDVPENVLVVDDILTTGATMRAVLDQLRVAGVTTLYAAVIARQPLDDSADLW